MYTFIKGITMLELSILVIAVAIFWSPLKRLVSTVENVVEGAEVLSSSLPVQAKLYNDSVVKDLQAKATEAGIEL